jgi:hypothetical protein
MKEESKHRVDQELGWLRILYGAAIGTIPSQTIWLYGLLHDGKVQDLTLESIYNGKTSTLVEVEKEISRIAGREKLIAPLLITGSVFGAFSGWAWHSAQKNSPNNKRIFYSAPRPSPVVNKYSSDGKVHSSPQQNTLFEG